MIRIEKARQLGGSMKCLLINVFLVFPVITKDLSIETILEALHWNQKDIEGRGKKEVEAFMKSGIWKGGYCEGNPLDPMGNSTYFKVANADGEKISQLYICYLRCIKPYVDKLTDVLEIGPGKGAWTRCFCKHQAKSIQCVDVLSAEYNNFWNNVGKKEAISYYSTRDFLLNCIKDNSIDYVFSFGTFCHISPVCCYEYFRNMYKKLRVGGIGFVMYADYDKKNAYANKHNLPHEFFLKYDDLDILRYKAYPIRGGRWYHLGIERAKEMLEKIGYTVFAADINVNERDPIIYFMKASGVKC